jgi:hypothetical protein
VHALHVYRKQKEQERIQKEYDKKIREEQSKKSPIKNIDIDCPAKNAILPKNSEECTTKVYRTLALKIHPDKNSKDEICNKIATEKFKQLNLICKKDGGSKTKKKITKKKNRKSISMKKKSNYLRRK